MTVCLTLTPADRAVDELIRALGRRGFVVIAPTVRDSAIVLDEVRDVSALPIGWTDEQEAATYRLRRRRRPIPLRLRGRTVVAATLPFAANADVVVSRAGRRRVRARRRRGRATRLRLRRGEGVRVGGDRRPGPGVAGWTASRPFVRRGSGASVLRRRQLRQPGRDLLLHVDGYRSGGRSRPRPRRDRTARRCPPRVGGRGRVGARCRGAGRAPVDRAVANRDRRRCRSRARRRLRKRRADDAAARPRRRSRRADLQSGAPTLGRCRAALLVLHELHAGVPHLFLHVRWRT